MPLDFKPNDVVGKLTTAAFFVQLALTAPSARAHAEGYLARVRLDATQFLAPPPTDPAGQASDLMAVRAWQGRASDPRWRQAQSDDDLSPFTAFRGVLGPAFTAERAPKTAKLFKALFADVKTVTGPAKVAFDRPRPPRVDPSIVTCAPLELTGSYPSGHAARGWLMALLLSEMLPDRADALLARGVAYGDSRVVCGEHFPSDVEAGRLVGASVLAAARGGPHFDRDLAAARAELRAALGPPAN